MLEQRCASALQLRRRRPRTSSGIAQIDFTGVEMASASPLRSMIAAARGRHLEHARRSAPRPSPAGSRCSAPAGRPRGRRARAKPREQQRAAPGASARPASCRRSTGVRFANVHRARLLRRRRASRSARASRSGTRMPQLLARRSSRRARACAQVLCFELQLAVLDVELCARAPARARARRTACAPGAAR